MSFVVSFQLFQQINLQFARNTFAVAKSNIKKIKKSPIVRRKHILGPEKKNKKELPPTF